MRFFPTIAVLLAVLVISSCSLSDDTRLMDIKVSVSPAEAGTILPSADSAYTKGEEIELLAEPSEGYIFTGWTGDINKKENPLRIQVDKNYSLMAKFELKRYELEIDTYGQGSVSERIVDQKNKDYEHGTLVELTAHPVDGWKFVEWQGDIGSTQNPIQLAIDQKKHVAAAFIDDQITLTVNKSGEGSVTVIPDKVRYQPGEMVEISVNASPGWRFEKWTGDLSGTENPVTVIMDSSIVTTALFANTTFAGGSGTESNPYKISNLEQLQAVGENLDAYFIQINDIDASLTTGWNSGKGFKPIGDDQSPFTGNYDGNDFSIDALYINRSGESFIGLFGETSQSEINNVILNDTFIEEAGSETGALVGKNDGNISFSHASGSIAGLGSTGGLVGENRGIISGSSSSVIIEDKLYGSRKGGLSGSNLSDGQIFESYAAGSVFGSDFVGGLVGFNEGVISRSYAVGDVQGGDRVGGLVGRNSLVAEILDSYARGDVSGTRLVGGLVGYNLGSARIIRSYSTGAVSGEESVGGFAGGFNSSSAIINWGYWDMETSGQDIGAGAGDPTGTIGLTTSEMTGDSAEDNMIVLDFNNVWVTTFDYPILRWQ